jgi:hypothetical protein
LYRPGSGAVKVDDVQARRPQGLPFKGNIQRVIGKDGLPVIVALVQSDAFAVLQVYGRYNLDFSASLIFIISELYHFIYLYANS